MWPQRSQRLFYIPASSVCSCCQCCAGNEWAACSQWQPSIGLLLFRPHRLHACGLLQQMSHEAWSVRLCVRHTGDLCKTAKLIEMLYGADSRGSKKPCRTPFSTWNHSDSVSATLVLTSCFLYSSASKSIKCRGYPMSIIVTQSLLWEIESNAFLKSTKHI